MSSGSKSAWMAAVTLALLLGVAAPAGAAAASSQDIRDIHGPIVLASSRPRWWAVGAGGVVVAAALGAAAWRRRGQRKLPPSERALRALAQQRALVGGHPRDFAVGVSETVRRYLEEAFAVHAPRRTTEELLGDLIRDRSGPLAAHQVELTEFLHQCDLAKFAGADLSTVRMNAMLETAEALVRASAAPARPAAAPLAGVA